MFANNEWRDHHNIKNNLVILSIDDLEPSPYFLRGFLGITLDVDFIMVNQFMFTFRRETGFLLNNVTSEQWIWRENQFGATLLNPKWDFKGEYFFWFCVTFITKFIHLASATIGFMLLSFVNGLVVRIALMCSNVVIFPLLWIIKTCTNENMNA